MAKQKTRGRTRKPADKTEAVLLTRPDMFAARGKVHRIPVGDGAVAMMREPTLDELQGFETLFESEDIGIEAGGIVAQALLVDESGGPVFENSGQACKALTVGQLGAVMSALEKLKDVESAEGN